MSKIDVILPSMGEGIIEATITRWMAEEGNFVEKDDSICEIATDKVDSELPSPASGILTEILFHEGEIPKVGQVIAVIQDDNKEQDIEEKSAELESKQKIFIEQKKQIQVENTVIENTQNLTEIDTQLINEHSQFSPFIRQLASDRNIKLHEIKNIKGTGVNGNITKEDLNSYIKEGRKFKDALKNTTVDKTDAAPGKSNEIYELKEGESIIDMDRTRKLIAQHMLQSKQISPHVSSVVEVDVTKMVDWRNNVKSDFFQQYNEKLTYTPVIVLSVAMALKKFPMINISVHNESIIVKSHINIGVATALNNGNLIVPVVKQADTLNLFAIVKKVNDLANRARNNALIPNEITGGTFTITNMGQFGNISGVPIINQPQAAILAVGSILKKPGIVKVNDELTIGIRDIMQLTLSYDHRVIDGALGGQFLKQIAENLTEFPDSQIENIGF